MDRNDSDQLAFVYLLLAEREPDENISHRSMPLYTTHKIYISESPHTYYIIHNEKDNMVGMLYETNMHEIGVFVHKPFRRTGIANKAINTLIKDYPDTEFLANINPRNSKSITLFESLGFNLIQQTYRLTKS